MEINKFREQRFCRILQLGPVHTPPSLWERGRASDTPFAPSNGPNFWEMGPYLADGTHILQMGPVVQRVQPDRRRVLSLRGYPAKDRWFYELYGRAAILSRLS
jgi:hypothetical protein